MWLLTGICIYIANQPAWHKIHFNPTKLNLHSLELLSSSFFLLPVKNFSLVEWLENQTVKGLEVKVPIYNVGPGKTLYILYEDTGLP